MSFGGGNGVGSKEGKKWMSADPKLNKKEVFDLRPGRENLKNEVMIFGGQSSTKMYEGYIYVLDTCNYI